MRRRLFSLLSIFFIFIFNINCVNAEACDNADIERLEQVAQGISYSYEYIGNEYNYQSYRFTFDYIPDELYIDFHGLMYYDSGSTVDVVSGTIDFDVYANDCYDTKITNISVDLPVFNEYSLWTDCLDIGSENLAICDEWYSDEISYDEYISSVNEYYDEVERENRTIFDFIMDYILYIAIGGCLLVLLIVVLIIYRRKRNVLK